MKKILKYIKENWEKILLIALSAIALIIMYLFPILGEIKHLKAEENKIESVNVKRRSAIEVYEDTNYINLLAPFALNTNEHYYFNNNGTLVSSSALTLTLGIPVYPNTYYVFDSDSHQVAYITQFTLQGEFISSQTLNGVFLTSSNTHLLRLSIFNGQLSSARLYMGNHVFQDYHPWFGTILDEVQDYGEDLGYNMGYTLGTKDGYEQGVQEKEDYYNELIIPETQEEYYEIGFEDGKSQGYNQGYYQGYNQGVSDGAEDFGILNFIRSIFNLLADVLTIEILPHIKLIYIVSIPLVLSVVKFVLGLFR